MKIECNKKEFLEIVEYCITQHRCEIVCKYCPYKSLGCKDEVMNTDNITLKEGE